MTLGAVRVNLRATVMFVLRAGDAYDGSPRVRLQMAHCACGRVCVCAKATATAGRRVLVHIGANWNDGTC